MRRFASIWLRVVVAVNFLTGAIGVPLYAHVCASMGTRALISSCTMHEDAFVPEPEPVVIDEPVISSCCSAEAADGAAAADAAAMHAGAVADEAAACHDAMVPDAVAVSDPVVSVDRVQTGDCCTDEDVTMQVTDSFTAVHDGHGMLPLGSAGVLALPGVPVVLDPTVASFFLYDFSPPPHAAEILSTTILLI